MQTIVRGTRLLVGRDKIGKESDVEMLRLPTNEISTKHNEE